MNERIKKLAEESFVITTDGKIGHANTFMVEKFAELIIRECARIADHGYGMVGYELLEHFGVE